jgi:hypothetical protein
MPITLCFFSPSNSATYPRIGEEEEIDLEHASLSLHNSAY